MSTIDTFTTAEDAWALVHHFLGNRLCAINLITERKDKGWKRDVSENKIILVGKLEMIIERLFVLGYIEEGAKVNQILQMVEDGDLTNPEIVQAIHDKNKELDPTARAFAKQVEKLRQARGA